MFEEILTDRCRLNVLNAKDEKEVITGIDNDQVIKYFSVSPKTFHKIEFRRHWFNKLMEPGTSLWWAIRFKDSDEIIGGCGFKEIDHDKNNAELGFWLLPQHWKKGIIQEVIPYIIRYGFEQLNLLHIEAITESENEASQNALLKLGFAPALTLPDCQLKDGKYISLYVFTLFNLRCCG
ncbi:GNAT family protein [Mucilaginibacter gynuensis]|uniref:GNAT family protein n=1 Tax=Mucilaginibacter gynuensis TaxID=1302236 RepID=A0ABP8G2W4_9SPHI